jgi:hypothetical protein
MGRYAFPFSQELAVLLEPRDGGSIASPEARSQRPRATDRTEPVPECHRRPRTGDQAKVDVRPPTRGGTRLAHSKGGYVM